ncbi:MAG: hypothetical protein AAFR13_09410 [Pseudomonadota bacterium]
MTHVLRAIVLAFMAFLMCASAALAQSSRQREENRLRLEFNRSPSSAIQFLEKRGFTDVKVLDRNLLALRVEACRENVRYRFQLRLDGRIFDESDVGRCGGTRMVTPDDVLQIARAQGMTRTQVEQGRQGFLAIGCDRQERRRFVLAIDFSGNVVNRRLEGECERLLTIDDVASRLEDNGYSQVRFKPDQKSPYELRACRDGVLMRLVVDGRGEIREEAVAGDCRRRFDAEELVAHLGQKGYSRIEVTDNTPPTYIAEACRDGRKYELVIGRRGRIFNEAPIGRCRDRVTAAALKADLQREGFYNIAIGDAQRGFDVTACFGRVVQSMKYNRFGDLTAQQEGTRCRAMNFRELQAIASARDVDRGIMVLDACRGDQGIIARLDRKGVYVEREVQTRRCRNNR